MVVCDDKKRTAKEGARESVEVQNILGLSVIRPLSTKLNEFRRRKKIQNFVAETHKMKTHSAKLVMKFQSEMSR